MRFDTVLAAVGFLNLVSAQGFYKKSDVLELDTTNFDDVVMKSNHTSIVEFYAPWCGHCKHLKNDYKKVGTALKDIVQVGAVNCDNAKNRKLCSEYKIEGYPTIIGFRPPKFNLQDQGPLRYAHATETFLGQRKVKPLVDFAISRVKNYVKRLITEEKLKKWSGNEVSSRPKAVVFTKRDTLSPLLKSIAIDYLGTIDFAYFPLKSQHTAIYENYNIDPETTKATLYFFPTGESDAIKYEGKLTKDALSEFFSSFDEISEKVESVAKRYDYLEGMYKGKPVKKSKKKSKKVDHDEL